MTDISGYVPAIYLILVSRCTNVRPRNLIVVMKHVLIHIFGGMFGASITKCTVGLLCLCTIIVVMKHVLIHIIN